MNSEFVVSLHKRTAENVANNKKNSTCALCNCKVDMGTFESAKSLAEYEISAMCQSCQDSIFGPDDDDSSNSE